MSEKMEISTEEQSPEHDSDHSDDDSEKLEIVITNRKKKTVKPTETEQKIIESVEEEIEKTLEEKANKANFNVANVKNILKHVVTNEHVLALVRKAENSSECVEEPEPIFEPKLTRAKAKQLSTEPRIPWVDPKVVPKVQELLKKKLKQDIVRTEVEDADGTALKDLTSATSSTAGSIQTTWSEDGLFKIPITKTKPDTENGDSTIRATPPHPEDTPPPKQDNGPASSDIDTDMEEAQPDHETDCEEYSILSTSGMEMGEAATPDPEADLDDMEYDEDWMDFLKKITMPLDEITKGTEDEELDPEYNILADEEVDKVDKEELRMDKAVKISKKELNALIAELLLDCANFNWGGLKEDENCQSQIESSQVETTPVETTVNIKTEAIYVTETQILIMEQQMRQHVQLLTQNFLLTYKHPEFHEHSSKFKEYLLNLNMLGEKKERSAFCAANLPNAIRLVGNWEARLSLNEEVRQLRLHFERITEEAWQCKQRGTFYIPTFPTTILETIAYSDVFLYTSLLPKIPYKSPRLYSQNVVSYTNAEDSLIALGLEQFTPFASHAMGPRNKVEGQLKLVCAYIQEYMLQYKPTNKLYTHIVQSKANKCSENPIKYYFRYKKAPKVVHFVMPLEQLQLVAPYRRPPNELPEQLKKFLHPSVNLSTTIPILPTVFSPNFTLPLTTNVCLQAAPSGHLVSFVSRQRPILPKITRNWNKRKRHRRHEKIPPSNENSFSQNQPQVFKSPHKNVDPITKFIEILSKPSDVRKLVNHYLGDSSCEDLIMDPKANRVPLFNLNENTVNQVPAADEVQDKEALLSLLPSMPQLNTPIKSAEVASGVHSSTPLQGSRLPQLDFSGVSSFQTDYSNFEIDCNESMKTPVADRNVRKDDALTEKDLSEDTQHLSGTTVKHPIRKEPSGAEKKKTKIRREFLANLSIATPEDPEVDKKKCETFALKYYDKMREIMLMEDYHKMVQVLNDHEKGNGVDLYKKVEPILRPRYPELADEFLLFLKDKEAAELNQLIPWIRVNNRWRFLRKLEIYFKDQPAQLKKIYKSLSELSQTMDVSMEKIKSTIVPMFKGNAVLTDLFLQDYMFEKPPPSLLDGPYETIDINKEIPQDEQSYETITLPDVEDKFGGQTCICSCHKIEDPEYISRLKHCIRCGTKFVNGKVFIQTGKGLRPANFSFLTNPDVDHSIRLTGNSCLTGGNLKRRCETSPFKQSSSSSPTKENCDEESDYDGDSKKKTRKRPQKKHKKQSDKASGKNSLKGKLKRLPRNTGSPSGKEDSNSNKPVRKRKYSRKKSDSKCCDDDKGDMEEKTDYKVGNSEGQKKRFAEESSDLEDNNHAGEVMSDVKGTSPEQNTAESESEFCEESSQDNCESDSNSSIASDNTQPPSEGNLDEGECWKREEDRIILATFQKENDKEEAFNVIARQLTNRTISQIRRRFDRLITLLMETIGKRGS